MKFEFDSRGVETVYQLGLIQRLFAILEMELVAVHDRAIGELKNDFTVESQEDFELMCSTVSSQECHQETEAQALRIAELVRLYMVLEKELKRFCASIKKERNLVIGWSDFGGSFIDQIRKFLCAYGGLMDGGDAIWRELDDFRIVRVYLVHGFEGAIGAKPLEDVKRLAKRKPQFGLLDGPEVVLSRALCDHFHEVVRRIFVILFEAVGWKTFRQAKIVMFEDDKQ